MNIVEKESIDDENYIFIDEEGKASKKYEIYIRCDLRVPVELLVTCDALDSLSFMRSLILDGLQKIESLRGLNNIEVQNLSRKGKVLPMEGVVKKYIRPTDHLTCEVLTKEVWIDLQIECAETCQTVTCQMKANRNFTIFALLKPIISVANEYIFSSYNLKADIENMNVFKVFIDKNKAQKREEFDLNLTVNDHFAHSSCKILAEVRSMPVRTLSYSYDSTLEGPMYLPIRKGKIAVNQGSDDGDPKDGRDAACCACSIF